MEKEDVRAAVREKYGAVARGEGKSCAPGCCGVSPTASAKLGYTQHDIEDAPDGANMGLGCGNPGAIADLKAGETVLDLGAGGGFDCFLAARHVGETGHVIGVDMTGEMVKKARANATKLGSTNIEFRLGEIEHLPVTDASVDVILSNCVINSSPDKPAVFREAFRVLKPGGRLAISDVIALTPLPVSLASELAAQTACIAGASTVEAMSAALEAAGFTEIAVDVDHASEDFIRDWLPGSGAEKYVASAKIRAVRPASQAACCGPSCCAPGAKA